MSLPPLIIEAAVNGATTPALNPAVPRSVAEIVADACACLDADATVVHHHNDEGLLEARHASAPYREAWTAIRTRAIDFVYQNTFADVRYMTEVCRARGIGAHISIFEPGFLRVALAYHAAGRLPGGVKIQLYFGGPALPFGLPPTLTSLDAYLDMLDGTRLPWMVGVLGGDVLATLAESAIRRGGHVRVRLEDYAGPDQPTNVALVRQVVDLAQRLGRRVATPAEAAAILGLPHVQ